jgi:hypothetical protein
VLPLVLYEVSKREHAHLQKGIESLLALALLILVARRPYKALNALVIVLPFGLLILSTLYKYHVPAIVVRGLGFYDEGIIAGLAVVAIVRVLKARPSFDGLDKMTFAYVVLGLAYLFLPKLFVGTAVGAHLSFYARELGWRSDVLYFGVFLICRHLGLQASQVWNIFRRFLVVDVVVAVIGFYQFLFPWSFNHLVVDTLGLPKYQAVVLHSPLLNPTNILAFGTAAGGHVRIGSVLINNLLAPWYFLFGLGIAIEMISRGKSRPWVVAAVPILSVALLLTQSRAAIGGGVVAVIYGLRSQLGRSIVQRVRMASMFALLGCVALPVIVFSGLGHRFVGSSVSNEGHVTGVREGIEIMADEPLGRGLATGAGGGQAAAGQGAISQSSVFVPEDQWLQIGTQLGVLGLAIYVGALILMLRRLRPRGQLPDDQDANTCAGGARIALVGILAGGLFLQPFIEPVISWTVFALCGLAVGAMDQTATDTGKQPRVLTTLPMILANLRTSV